MAPHSVPPCPVQSHDPKFDYLGSDLSSDAKTHMLQLLKPLAERLRSFLKEQGDQIKEESFIVNRTKQQNCLYFPSAYSGSPVSPPSASLLSTWQRGRIGADSCLPQWMYKKCEWLRCPCISWLLCCAHLSTQPSSSELLSTGPRLYEETIWHFKIAPRRNRRANNTEHHFVTLSTW